MKEAWYKIPRYNGKYEISNHGNVRNATTGRRLSTLRQKNGCPRVQPVNGDGRQEKVMVKVLMWETFRGSPPPDSRCIRHRDGDRGNCSLDNLFVSEFPDVSRVRGYVRSGVYAGAGS